MEDIRDRQWIGADERQTVEWVQSVTPQQLKLLRTAAERGSASAQCKLGRGFVTLVHLSAQRKPFLCVGDALRGCLGRV